MRLFVKEGIICKQSARFIHFFSIKTVRMYYGSDWCIFWLYLSGIYLLLICMFAKTISLIL